jgi:hypothetical protein
MKHDVIKNRNASFILMNLIKIIRNRVQNSASWEPVKSVSLKSGSKPEGFSNMRKSCASLNKETTMLTVAADVLCAAARRGSPTRYHRQQAELPIRSDRKRGDPDGRELRPGPFVMLCTCRSTHTRKHILRYETQSNFIPHQIATDPCNTHIQAYIEGEGREAAGSFGPGPWPRGGGGQIYSYLI